MSILEAIKLLIEKFEKAKSAQWVHDPVAFALYHTWVVADEADKREE